MNNFNKPMSDFNVGKNVGIEIGKDRAIQMAKFQRSRITDPLIGTAFDLLIEKMEEL